MSLVKKTLEASETDSNFDFDSYLVDLIIKDAKSINNKNTNFSPSFNEVDEAYHLKPNIKPNKIFLENTIVNTTQHNNSLLKKLNITTRNDSAKFSSKSSNSKSTTHSITSKKRKNSELETSDWKRKYKTGAEDDSELNKPNNNTDKQQKGIAKGRGFMEEGADRLDKYFNKNYNPNLDADNFDDTNMDIYVENLIEFAEEKKKEKKEAKKKKKEENRKKKELEKEEKSRLKKLKKKSDKREEKEVVCVDSQSDSDDSKYRRKDTNSKSNFDDGKQKDADIFIPLDVKKPIRLDLPTKW
ncbi:hypothetical protein HK099_000752 [Clydaea vesicula]|uniref:Uncharacterized protein n=1 Tax=Clydaea vesicula TaxID=447962 RepID=A0AAD5XZY0_9FUNG|nr:hypothetical protein HK099_000752 [Clydaea vesicula]